MKYEIITAIAKSDLVELVNQMIALGWEPQGGVSAYWLKTHACHAQAMLKKDELT